jgi:hypothetical protein
MLADQTLTTYLPLVELMDRVETTKVLWVLTALLVAALTRIYFLNARVKKLEGCEPQPTATGWIRPTRQMIMEVPNRTLRASNHAKHAYPNSALTEIHPWSTESIAALSMYMRQSVSLGEIALQRRLATVSAIVHGFAIPADVMLLDEGAIAIYLDYRARVSPALGSPELMQYAYVGQEETMDELKLKELVRLTMPVIGQLLQYAEKEAWPVLDVFYRDLLTAGIATRLDRSDLKSIVTAYSAYAKMLVPSEYVLNSATAFCIYRRISTMALFDPVEQQA